MIPGQEVDSWLPGLWEVGAGWVVAEECWVSSGGNENILRWTVVMVAQVGEDSALNPSCPAHVTWANHLVGA